MQLQKNYVNKNIGKCIRICYNKIIQSIAFYPAIIALGFLLFSVVMLEVDFSSWGKQFKSGFSWLTLKDASTARSIIATVAGAIISLTVFSFSMVMIVLNQAASQMSNRVLSSMIENRFQQMVLGVYIGTIVYALFLLSTIRDIDSGVSVPALSIYLLILLTVVDIFLFIYFLDYVTQTVKYETVIDRVKEKTLDSMKHNYTASVVEMVNWTALTVTNINAPQSDYFQGFTETALLKLACEKNICISFCYRETTYLVKGMPLLLIYSAEKITDECIEIIMDKIDFYKGKPIFRHAEYGFDQLAEVAIKALSPGINDPATAVLSIHALTDLFRYHIHHQKTGVLKDTRGEARISRPVYSFAELFEKCIHPILTYGGKDQYIQNELLWMIAQLKMADEKKVYQNFFDDFANEVNSRKVKPISNTQVI